MNVGVRVALIVSSASHRTINRGWVGSWFSKTSLGSRVVHDGRTANLASRASGPIRIRFSQMTFSQMTTGIVISSGSCASVASHASISRNVGNASSLGVGK